MRLTFIKAVIIIHYKMINLDSITNENNKWNTEKWTFITDYSYRILIIGSSGSGKTNTLHNLISQQDDIDKIYLYTKELSELKYEFLIKNRENVGIKYLNDSNAFTECSNTTDDAYENNDDYNERVNFSMTSLLTLWRIKNVKP